MNGDDEDCGGMGNASASVTRTFDPATEPPSGTVIEAVAAATDVDPTELEPVFDRIDPEALDNLFRPLPDGTPRAHGRVSFVLHNRRVTVDSDGVVEVTPLAESQ